MREIAGKGKTRKITLLERQKGIVMKKLLLLSVLVLAIVSSVVAGTLANYTISIDSLAYGTVVGKEFVFIEDGMDTFSNSVKIAPGESVQWQFAVKNYSGSVVTETELYYKLTFKIQASTGKQAIDPLVVTVKDGNDNTVGMLTGTGTLSATGVFQLSNTGQDADFSLQIYWPQNDSTDMHYAGSGFGTSITVSALASQLPIN
jgi:hypothetical protein